MTIAGICELALETDDVDRLQALYKEEPGLKLRLSEDEDRAEEGVMALAMGNDGA